MLELNLIPKRKLCSKKLIVTIALCLVLFAVSVLLSAKQLPKKPTKKPILSLKVTTIQKFQPFLAQTSIKTMQIKGCIQTKHHVYLAFKQPQTAWLAVSDGLKFAKEGVIFSKIIAQKAQFQVGNNIYQLEIPH